MGADWEYGYGCNVTCHEELWSQVSKTLRANGRTKEPAISEDDSNEPFSFVFKTNDQFTKTGSGHTFTCIWEKLSEKGVVCRRIKNSWVGETAGLFCAILC